MTKRVRVFVSGRVQGVFFRVECARMARDAGVGGSARNLPDGRVEAAFEGPDENVDRLVEWCRRGPSGARVERIDVHEEPPTGEGGFAID